MQSTSSELLSSVLDDLGEGVWMLDIADARVLDLNEAAARSLGCRPEELAAARFGDLVVPPMPPEGWRLLVDQIPAGGTHHVTVSMGRPAPQATELVCSRRNLPQAPGREVVVAIARSVRRPPVDDVRPPHRRFEQAAGALDSAVALVDANGRIEQVTDRFAELVDLPADDLVGRSVFDPPWRQLDAHGVPVPPERGAAAVAIRTAAPVRGLTGRLPGTGRRRAVDEHRWVRSTAVPILDASGRPDGVALSLDDVTELERLRSELERTRSTDQLTGLLSRTGVVTHLEDVLAGAEGVDGARVAVLHLDLDNFRGINDTFGTSVGDRLLAGIGERLRDLPDRHVHIGRIGVDEFLVVVRGNGPSAAFDARLRRLAEELQRRVEQRFELEGFELRMTASVGVARWPGDGHDAGSLQRAADRALTAARRHGRHQLRFYERSIDEHTRTGLALDRDLRRAAAQRELEVHYQPIIDLRTGRVAAAEALVRWNHPERGPIPPSVFIPTAEATGAITAISELVLTTVADDLAHWNRGGSFPTDARVAVNVSATEFTQRAFVEHLAAILDHAGVRPDQLELEITETLLMRDVETTVARLRALDELGVLVALDDFGTGYSSLSYLHSLPLHTLKVDRCFVGDLRDGRSETITRAILSLAHGLGIVAVGEGVETEEQRRFLIDAGCDLVQGFYYAPPLPRAAFEAFLADQAG